MKTNIIPCPINEKDLCSDTLFDDLFDRETKQIEEWARTIEDSYNENLIDEDVRLNVRFKVFAKSSEVYFEYIITEN